MHLDAHRHGFVWEYGDEHKTEAQAKVKQDGWSSQRPWESENVQTAKHEKLPVRTGKPTTEGRGRRRQVVRMSVQFRPEGPAEGRTDHLFSGRGSSELELGTETECAWCKQSTRMGKAVCNPTLEATATGGFDVEAETLGTTTTFRYRNESDEAKLRQLGRSGEVGVAAATPKAGVGVGPVTLTEVQLAIKPAEHNARRKVPAIRGSDQFDHAQSLRCTIRAVSSTTSVAKVTQEADASTVSAHWSAGCKASATVRHDLQLHGEVAATWPFPVRPSIGVHLHNSDDGHAIVTIDGGRGLLHSPCKDQVGTHWWQRGPFPKKE